MTNSLPSAFMATAAVSRFLCSFVARAVFLESRALFRDRLTRSSLTSFTLLSSAAAVAAAAVAAVAAVAAHDGIDGRPCTQQQQGRRDAISALSPTAAASLTRRSRAHRCAVSRVTSQNDDGLYSDFTWRLADEHYSFLLPLADP